LANREDRQYRTWRRLSRSWPIWTLFNSLPTSSRERWAGRLEARMRSTNLAFKRQFPEAEIRRYARGFFATGHDLVVLGHFHVERDIVCEGGRVVVLPEWKGSRRYLEARSDGLVGFVDS
jgi:UDP-2,3-diacylglucosamine pyrophosphatase LpxH